MKVAQLRKALDAAAKIYEEAGNPAVSDGIRQLSGLCADHETKTVAAFATAINKALATTSSPAD